MLFNSLHFTLFFFVVLCLYWAFPAKWKKPLLLFASYYFYGAWDIRFVALLIGTTSVDFFCARKIHIASTLQKKKLYLIVSLSANLLVLGFFKYFNFFTASFCSLFSLHDSLGLSIILPVGVSFYTFQSMSYTIDVYRSKVKPASALDYFLFVSFFPQLVAGPIVRADQFLPQEREGKKIDFENLHKGIVLFLHGFVKKVLFADILARAIDPIFANPLSYSSGACLLAVYGFAFQIFWDFSGYTDMARGVAKTLGYDLPINFNLPYLSASFGEFWKRWHISLSSWLRDYLYIGLGGNRRGAIKTLRNVFITMALGGLWHGAQWHFVVWGIFHGMLLIVEHGMTMLVKSAVTANRLVLVLRRLIVFHCVCIGWILFRCPNLTVAKNMFVSILSGQWSLAYGQLFLLASVMIFMVWEIVSALANSDRHGDNEVFVKIKSVLSGAAVALAFIYSTTSAPFLYFQF